jgi:DNA-directed RNA polymerase alpha subunit
MPVQKVDFKIENVYDTANNITERLFIDIWTNGSISPNEALTNLLLKLLLTYLLH